MGKKRRLPAMLIPTLIVGLLAVILVFIGYQKGVHIQGLRLSWSMLIQIVPLMVLAFIAAGMIQTLIPREIIARWIGVESGFRGILIGTVMGCLTPTGGPWVTLPIAAGLLRSGAVIGTTVAYITAWSLLALARIPVEVGIMGWQFTLIRMACVFFLPPIAGLIANIFFSHVKLV